MSFNLWQRPDSALYRVMNALCCLILFPLTVLVCPAAEIVAWKVPLSRFVGGGLGEKGMVRCKSAPEASPFFKEGDELWNLKEVRGDDLGGEALPTVFLDSGNALVPNKTPLNVLGATSPPLEWVIWNQSSGRLVTKSDWSGIWQMNQRLGMDGFPKQCRLTAEVLEVPADGSPVTANAVPAMVFSCVSRSGKEFEASQQNGGGTVRTKGRAILAERSPFVDLVIDMDCILKNQRRVFFKTGVTLRSDTPFWIARDFDGKKGIDIRISCGIELVDGTAAKDSVLIQEGDIVTPLEVNKDKMERHRIGDKGWLAIQWMKPENLQNFSPQDNIVDLSSDPFADNGPTNKVKQLLGFAEVRPPGILNPWFEMPVWNLRDWMEKSGIHSDATSEFVGYDLSTQRMFLFSNDETELDKFECLLTLGCNLQPRMVSATFEGNGLTRMVTCSGQQCRLERFGADQKVIRSIEIEPTIGENNDMVDVHFDYRDESNSDWKQSIMTAVTLNPGQYSEVVTGISDGGEKSAVRLVAEIVGTAP